MKNKIGDWKIIVSDLNSVSDNVIGKYISLYFIILIKNKRLTLKSVQAMQILSAN